MLLFHARRHGAPERGRGHQYGPPFHPHLQRHYRHRGRFHFLSSFSIRFYFVLLCVLFFCILFAALVLWRMNRFFSPPLLNDINASIPLSDFIENSKDFSKLILAIRDVKEKEVEKYLSSLKAAMLASGSSVISWKPYRNNRDREKRIFYYSERSKLKEGNDSTDVYYEHSIAFYLSRMKEDSSSAAKNVLNLLAGYFFLGQVNEHIKPRYHPLTCAYRQQRYGAADAIVNTVIPPSVSFINSPSGFLGEIAPILEVYASYLDCSDIPHVHSKVTLITFMGERRPCVLEFPRTVPFASSKLYQYLENNSRNPDPFESLPQSLPVVRHSSRRTVVPSTKESLLASPFLKPPVGVLPSTEQTIMNPACFEDFLHAVAFYFFGSFSDASATLILCQSAMKIAFCACIITAVVAIFTYLFILFDPLLNYFLGKCFPSARDRSNNLSSRDSVTASTSSQEGNDRNPTPASPT